MTSLAAGSVEPRSQPGAPARQIAVPGHSSSRRQPVNIEKLQVDACQDAPGRRRRASRPTTEAVQSAGPGTGHQGTGAARNRPCRRRRRPKKQARRPRPRMPHSHVSSSRPRVSHQQAVAIQNKSTIRPVVCRAIRARLCRSLPLKLTVPAHV